MQAVGPVAMDAMMTASVVTNILGTERAAQCDPLSPSTCGEYIGLTVVLAFFTGLLQMCFGVFHLGVMVNFLSHSVMSGFTSAAAIVIGLSQFKYLLGVDVPRQTYAWQTVYELAKAVPELDLNNLPVAILCCAIIYGLKQWKKTRYVKSNPSKVHQYKMLQSNPELRCSRVVQLSQEALSRPRSKVSHRINKHRESDWVQVQLQ